MRKATATYHAPKGDNEVVHMGGLRFIDGQAVELNSDEHPHLIKKLEENPHFEFEIGPDDGVPKPKRGRPSNAEKEAKAAAQPNDKPTIPCPAPGDPAPGTASTGK